MHCFRFGWWARDRSVREKAWNSFLAYRQFKCGGPSDARREAPNNTNEIVWNKVPTIAARPNPNQVMLRQHGSQTVNHRQDRRQFGSLRRRKAGNQTSICERKFQPIF